MGDTDQGSCVTKGRAVATIGVGVAVPHHAVRTIELRDEETRRLDPGHQIAYAELLSALFPATEHLVLLGTCRVEMQLRICQRLPRLRRVTTRFYRGRVTGDCLRAALLKTCPRMRVDNHGPQGGAFDGHSWPDSIHGHFTFGVVIPPFTDRNVCIRPQRSL